MQEVYEIPDLVLHIKKKPITYKLMTQFKNYFNAKRLTI
jgi:hypothetical protein